VRVDFVTDLRRIGCFMMRFSIIPNIIMLCLKPRLTIRVVVLGFVKAKWITLTAIAVVFPVCLAQQATIRLFLQLNSSDWYGKSSRPRIASANSTGLLRSCSLSCSTPSAGCMAEFTYIKSCSSNGSATFFCRIARH